MKMLSLNFSAVVNNKKLIAVGLIAFLGGVLVCGALLNLSQIIPYLSVSGEPLQKFASYEELVDFVGKSSTQPYYFVGTNDDRVVALVEAEGAKTSSDYSTTNVQVAGVDEADIVKSDGKYLYVISDQRVFIIRAYPPAEAEILSKIELNVTLHGIFVYQNRLVVLGSEAYETRILIDAIKPGIAEPYYMPYYTPNTFIRVYDITDRTSPLSVRNVTIDGYYFSSRMIGNYVYAIVNEPVQLNGTEVKLPTICIGNETDVVPATDIYFSAVTDYGFTFTSVFAVNVARDTEVPTRETILLGTTRSIYTSYKNIYVAFSDFDSFTGAEKTLVYRIEVDGSNIENKASGGVPGGILNQFSMDEHASHFRIATTVGTWEAGSSRNNVYVLNMSLDIVGKLENLAPTERIYSVRFMGDRCYLVTFLLVDPFFVLDLSSPADPKVLGYLKIPGFSNYLHPYDEDHIIGIGKEGNNVKMSLFDVTNVTEPTETAHFAVQGDWSDSTALWDQKAFLFNGTRRLLAIPVMVSVNKVVDEQNYTWSYTWSYWQGSYVFDISLEQGFILRGNVTHQESTTGYFPHGSEVRRILYIDNVLYTVSDRKMVLSDLDTLKQLGEIELL
jgi:uncharacterized secreted protein with C-terminal beta-propeller domain